MTGWDGSLTLNAVMSMSKGDTSLQPVVQVAEIRKVPNVNNTERWRLQVSDGQYYFSSMLASQLNPMVHSNELQNLCIVRLNEFIANTVQGRRVLVILNMEVLCGPQAFKIGSPVDVNSAPSTAVNNTTPSPQPQRLATGAVPAATAGYRPPASTNYGGGAGARPGQTNFAAGGGGARQPGAGEPWRPGQSTAIARVGNGQTGLSGQVNYLPIHNLNPYQNKWTIRGRIINKGNIRKYANAKGPGQVMSFEIADDSASIKVACFQEMAQKMSDVIQMGKLFSISRATVKQADKRFNRCTSQYEMMLNYDSEVEPIADDGSVAQVKYNFVKIGDLENVDAGTFHDVLGIVKEVSEIVELHSRTTGDLLKKRVVTIVDDSERTIGLTVWGETAENLVTSEAGHPVILCKGVRRGDYQGISLDGVRSSFFELNPDIPEAHTLKGWYDAGGQSAAVRSVSGGVGGGGGALDGERTTFDEVSVQKLKEQVNDPKGVVFTERATLMMIKKDRDLWYTACPETNKKVVPTANGRWRCEATDKEYDHCNYRYILNANVYDSWAPLWVSMFDESAVKVLGKTAEEMNTLRETDNDEYERILHFATWRDFVVRVRARQESWQEELRVKYQVLKLEPMDYARESKVLLSEIKEYF